MGFFFFPALINLFENKLMKDYILYNRETMFAEANNVLHML